MVAATDYTQSRFFEDELIQHESVIVREMVLFLAREELRAEDFDNYKSASSQLHFEQSFSILKNIPGVIRIRLYNAESTVILSDVKGMVGKNKPRTKERITQMWTGTYSSIFDPYLILGLIGFRLIWGMVGGPYARFTSFLYSPIAGLSYLRQVISGGGARHPR